MILVYLIILYLSLNSSHSACSGGEISPSCGSLTLSQEESACIQNLRPADKNWVFGEHAKILPVTSPDSCRVKTDNIIGSQNSFLNHNITGISVNKSFDGGIGRYQLHLESNILAYTDCVLSLNIASSLTSSDRQCKVYHLTHIEEKAFRASFEDQCFISLQKNSVYDLNITSPQSESYTRIYRFFTTRDNLLSDQELSQVTSLTAWSVLIGVNVHADQIKVLLQSLPALSDRKLFLRLHYFKGDGIIQLEEKEDRIIQRGTSVVRFDSAGDLTYTLTLYSCPSSEVRNKLIEGRCAIIQSHSFHSADIHTQQQEEPQLVTERMDSTAGAGDDAVSVKETEPGVLQKQDLYILLGTIFGVIFLVLVIAVILLIYFKRRHGSHYGLTARFSGGNVYSDGMLLEEDIKGSAPTVLLLYSYDCQNHLSCVQSLALLLQNALGCTVMADFWATQEIAERGIHAWLQHKLATVNYVIVVCSAGARFKSVSARRAQLEQESDDAYIAAIRQLQSDSDSMGHQKMVVYFEYSSESDIPVLLENWQRYKLMQDIHSFIPTVVEYMSPKEGLDLCKCGHERVYIDTLSEKIAAAKKYMTNNPDWFHENLQALLPAAASERSQHSDNSSGRQTTSAPPPLRSSQQLEMVTVEHNRTLSESDRDTDIDITDSQTSQHSSNPRRRHDKPVHLRAYTPPPISVSKSESMSPMRTKKPKVESGISSLDSYSSSLEDLEHDINFILNPSLPSKTMNYTSSAQGLIDILPHLHKSSTASLNQPMLRSNGLILTVPSSALQDQTTITTACAAAAAHIENQTSKSIHEETKMAISPALITEDQNNAQLIINPVS